MKVRKWLACFLALALAATTAACGGGGESKNESPTKPSSAAVSTAGNEEDGPLTPYAEEITMSFGRDSAFSGADSQKLTDAGEPYTDNRWIKLYKEKLNVNAEYALNADGEQYDQQIKLGMGSGDLPDCFIVKNWADYQQMCEAGILTDMTELYEKYASPLLRSILEKDGSNVYMPCIYDGKLYGIPRAMPSTNGYNHCWIRQDWLDNLGLDRPTTMDELLDVIRAFKNDDPDGNGVDDTWGLRMDNTYLSQKAPFWAYGAYPDFWITKDDGTVDYGSVQPEMKKGLAFLRGLVEEGLVNPEFVTLDNNMSGEDVVAGKIGLYFRPHWETPKDSHAADPNAEWVVIPPPTENGDLMEVPLTLNNEGALVVRAGVEHPEAPIKMLNAYVEALFGETGDFNYYFTMEGVAPIWGESPLFTLDPALDVDGCRQWIKAEETGDYDNMTGSGKGFYDFAQEGLEEYAYMFGPKDTAFSFVDKTYPDNIIWNAYFGAPTPTQAERWSSMNELLNTSMAEIVTGVQDLDSGFDKMVSDWKSMGGDQVVQEINDALAAYNG